MLFSLPCVRLADLRSRAARRATWSLALGLGLVILTALAPAARAADTAWSGATDSAWGTSGNWSAGVPTSVDNAQLVNGASNTTISLTGSNAANQLQVWSGATYTLTSSAPATLALSDQLYLFSDPDPSSLTLGGSLSVSTPNGSIGTGGGDVGGTLSVASGASLSVANTFHVGYDGKLNQLQVTGGTFAAKDLVVAGGTVTSFSNSVIVNGGALSATNSLVVGALGTSNLLTGASGSIIVTGTGGAEVGKDVTADYNVINLTGASFSATNSLIVGRDGDHNEFNVTNGSVATTGQARIGLNATGDYNKVLVSGSGSQWTANGTVRVGSDGDHNELIIANGGTMTVAGAGKNLWIGYSGSSGSNLVAVRGAGSLLDVSGVGSEVVISGSTTGSGNFLELSTSGSANVNSVQLGPGGALVFGQTGTNAGAAGFIKSSATINGNLGTDPNRGGGAVYFTSTTDVVLPNVLSGPLFVGVATPAKTTLSGANTYTGATVIYSGTLALGPAGSIASSSDIALYTPTVSFDVSAVSGGYQLASGQKLYGIGTVIGPATGAVGSTVLPGAEANVGTLTVTGGFTLLGDLIIDVDGATTDLLDGSSGGLTLGGNVTFNQISAPSGNLIFAKYASLAGTFGSVTGLPSGYSIDYNYLSGNQIALVSGAVPEIDPASAGSVLAVLGGAAGLLERRLRRRRA